ncbi:Uncharacterised protein [Klebsiella pneumoniae]|nr:Uncharacterised protein [Klebsiella pneumoniae]
MISIIVLFYVFHYEIIKLGFFIRGYISYEFSGMIFLN